MSALYLALNIGSILFPLIYSIFKPEILMNHWRPFLKSSLIVGLFFILWDVWFTAIGVWGFNKTYLIGVSAFGLPLEEYIFFIFITYASNFIHYSLAHFYPKVILNVQWTKMITYALLALGILLVIFNHDKYYTAVNLSVFVATMLLGLKFGLTYLQRFYIAFPIILVPFFIVNGVLTGSWIPDQVVWYNNAHNLGIRLGTIPVEDTFYAFSLLFLNVLLLEYFKRGR